MRRTGSVDDIAHQHELSPSATDAGRENGSEAYAYVANYSEGLQRAVGERASGRGNTPVHAMNAYNVDSDCKLCAIDPPSEALIKQRGWISTAPSFRYNNMLLGRDRRETESLDRGWSTQTLRRARDSRLH